MGFWTRVRLPSTPLESQASNTVRDWNLAVFKNEFALILDTNQYQADCDDIDTISYTSIQRYVKERYGIQISKSTISQVKAKCGLKSFERSQAVTVVEDVKSEKEKIVLEAFRELGLVN